MSRMPSTILDIPLYTTVGQGDVACFLSINHFKSNETCGNKLVISTLSEGIA